MISLRLRAFSVLLGVAVLSTSTAAGSKPRTYAIIDLGTLPGDQSSQANDINELGQVVGTSRSNEGSRPFVWRRFTMTELPLLPLATGGAANSINNRGVIVGMNAVDGVSRAVMWIDGAVIELGLPADWSCQANAINEHGHIVGSCTDLTTFTTSGFSWKDGQLTPIGGSQEGEFTEPTGVNNRGVVVGVKADFESPFGGFAWLRGRLYDLTAPDGFTSAARIVNSHDDIAGWLVNDTDFTSQAVVWKRGEPLNLGGLEGARLSEAWAINNHFQVTGRSDFRPFIWEGGEMRALPTLQFGTGLGLAINNAGAIAGQADNAYGQSRAVIWVDSQFPIREPGIVWNFGPGSGLVTPGEGRGAVLFNASTLQNFADTVRFSRPTHVTGMNVYTSSSHLPLLGTHYRVKIFADANGLPGALVAEFDVEPSNIAYVGEFETTARQLADVHRVRLNFPAVTFAARTTYWIGASGVNFDAGLYGLAAPGNGRMAEFSGEAVTGLAPATFGDMMFQLISAPAPAR